MVEGSEDLVIYGLIAILVAILLGPMLSRRIEENIGLYFLAMGSIAATISGSWSLSLVIDALLTPVSLHGLPIGIFQVVLVAGILFVKYGEIIERAIGKLATKYSVALIYAIMVFILGLASSVISVIVASVILVEIAVLLKLRRDQLVKVLIAGAYAVGAGAALTPIGEPLSTIAVAKLSAPPYNADFLFLFRLLWDYVIPIVAIFSIYSYYILRNSAKLTEKAVEDVEAVHVTYSSYKDAVERAVRIYIFIVALVILGHSMDPLVERFIIGLRPELLYIFGSISAAVDNATLVAAIISPELELHQIKSFLISLIISGGFLIPGNVPNIIISIRVGIKFKEWAKIALPMGVPVFIAAYIALFILNL